MQNLLKPIELVSNWLQINNRSEKDRERAAQTKLDKNLQQKKDESKLQPDATKQPLS